MNKGFSLVELIVVIAIMAILVGVAVPVYTSYIDKANVSVDKQYLGELEAAINTVYVEFKADPTLGAIPTKITLEDGELTATGADDGEFIKAVAGIIDIKDVKLDSNDPAIFTLDGLTFECDKLQTTTEDDSSDTPSV